MKFTSLVVLSFAGVISASSLHTSIFSRQSTSPFNSTSGTPTDSIPAECQDRCAVLDDLNQCEVADGIECPCSQDKASKYVDCMNCALATDDTDDNKELLQSVYDLYQSACKTGGVDISDATVEADAGDSTTTSTSSAESSSGSSSSDNVNDNTDGAVKLGMSVGVAGILALTVATLL